MAHDLETLLLARRHVAEAEARIDRQRRLMVEMRAKGQGADVAQELLDTLVETTRQMRRHRDYLEGHQPPS